MYKQNGMGLEAVLHKREYNRVQLTIDAYLVLIFKIFSKFYYFFWFFLLKNLFR